MGITLELKMKFGLAFITAAVAAERSCYSCIGDPTVKDSCKNKDDQLVTVIDCPTGQCYTVQYNDMKFADELAETFYERGCNPSESSQNFDNGCVTTTQGGNACYKGCSGDKCNDHTGLKYDDEPSSAGYASIGFMATILYML